MRILLVSCHPAPESYHHSIVASLRERLESAGHHVRAIDLYAEGFDPVLDAEAWRAHRQQRRHAPELDPHIEALSAAEGLLLVYPTWWFGMPAILKGWLDRVWQPGVAFAVENGVFKTRYLTRLRRFGVVTTYGSPRFVIEWLVGDPMRRLLMRGLALQFAKGVRTSWQPIYNLDSQSRDALSRARDRAVTRIGAFFDKG